MQDVNEASREATIRPARLALGSRLREIRESRGMTLTAVARQAGLSRSFYTQVEHGRQTMLLDGDNLRQGINSGLGFDSASRSENVRRVGEIAKLMVDAGLIVIVALVSPFHADRARAASLLPPESFVEIFVDTPVEVCRQRDTKGLHALADKGRISNLTGRDQPYEAPDQPSLILRTTELTADEAANRIVALVLERA